jgi:hypothetical protein
MPSRRVSSVLKGMLGVLRLSFVIVEEERERERERKREREKGV